MKDMVGGCCVCSDERGWPENPLVYCDGNGCTVAVHQACYGIVTVPTGPWYCRKCESSDRLGRARCELCPSRSGALKRVATGGWAHVVCALYIPEVRFGNVTSMEPIILELIPQERFNKTCYICQEAGKVHRAVAGACMQCNKSGCKQQFHVTCAQGLGLLCEEAGNYLDNVKYCGYCQHHYGKLKKGGNVKTIPPYKPSHDSQSSDSSGEREGDASPAPGGSATPTHTNRNRPATGRKTSHSASSATARATPSTSKTPTQTAQSFGGPSTASTSGRGRRPSQKRGKHSAEKSTKKVSPPAESSRRSSVASDTSPAPTTSAGSKPTTPVPSPQRTTPVAAQDPPIPTTKGSRSVGGGTPTSSPGTSTKPVEPHSVISSVSATSTVTSSSSVATVSLAQPVSTASQVPQKPAPVYQESVITNTDVSGEYKHTKKRKAASQSTTPTPAPEYPATPPPPNSLALMKKTATRKPGVWGEGPEAADATVADKVKKAKIDSGSMEGVTYGHLPPPQSPTSHGMPSPRHQVSPVIQTRTNPGRNIRCPQTQGGRPAAAASGEAGSASLLVSVPLPPASQGLNLSAQTQVAAAAASEGPAPTALSFYQLQKQVTEQAGSVRTHSPQPSTSRAAWGGLQVSYEMQQPADKSLGGGAGANTSTIRSNKKRAAMNTSVVAHSNTAVSALQSTSGQPASASKQQNTPPLPPPPPPSMPPPQPYVLLDSPPGSPVFEKTVRTKVERSIVSGIAHHMLGNELNPDSSSAARLSEQLNAELAAHSVGLQPPSPSSVLYPPPLINRATSGSGRSTTAGGGAQSLDQLLERQWDQGGQLIMEQAQHFDKNVRLEDHVANLERRRDHLLAVNARLANSLAAGTPQPEGSRCPRENGSQVRPPGVVRGDSQSADGSEQIMMRELQQKPS